MRAILCTAYGSPDVLQQGEVAKPSPKAKEVRIKIVATAVTPGDCEMRTLTMHPTMYPLFRLALGITKPRNPILGMYFSGIIDALGADVSEYRLGEAVFGTTSFSMGTNAEYVCVAAKGSFIPKPEDLSHVDAAATPLGAWNALYFLERAELKAEESILIVGAGGAIGTFAIQLAKLAGARVTAIDSGPKLSMLRDIGADQVIDYEAEDFTNAGQRYDVIFDVVGKSPYRRSLACLNPGGRYLLANVGFTPMIRGVWTSKTTGFTVISAPAPERKPELKQIRDLLLAGKIKPVVDRCFTLEEIPEAHRYIDAGKRKGNIVAVISD